MSGTDTSPETSKDDQPNQPGGLTMTDNEPDHIDNLRSQLRYQISLREAQLTTIKNQQAELDRVQRLLGVEMTAADARRAELADCYEDLALNCEDLANARHEANVAEAAIARVRELCELAIRDPDSGVGIEDIVNAIEGNQP